MTKAFRKSKLLMVSQKQIEFRKKVRKISKPSPVGHTVGRLKKQRKNLIFPIILISIGKAPEVRSDMLPL